MPNVQSVTWVVGRVTALRGNRVVRPWQKTFIGAPVTAK